MDEFAAVSRTGQAGLISKCLERCYLYRELEGLQEQQQEEEEQGPFIATLAAQVPPRSMFTSTGQEHKPRKDRIFDFIVFYLILMFPPPPGNLSFLFLLNSAFTDCIFSQIVKVMYPMSSQIIIRSLISLHPSGLPAYS